MLRYIRHAGPALGDALESTRDTFLRYVRSRYRLNLRGVVYDYDANEILDFPSRTQTIDGLILTRAVSFLGFVEFALNSPDGYALGRWTEDPPRRLVSQMSSLHNPWEHDRWVELPLSISFNDWLLTCLEDYRARLEEMNLTTSSRNKSEDACRVSGAWDPLIYIPNPDTAGIFERASQYETSLHNVSI